MRLFRSPTLLLTSLLITLAVPSAFADDLYQVEMILVRQNAEKIIYSSAAPEDWAAGAQRLGDDSKRTPALGNIAANLTADGKYTVLMHKAWQQTLGETPVKVAVSEGAEQYGQFPVEGTVEMKVARFVDINADFWVNQIGGDGTVTATEHLKQTSHTKNGQLNFLDGGHLGLLIKITSLTAPAPREAPEVVPD